jgi:hypothetical protein
MQDFHDLKRAMRSSAKVFMPKIAIGIIHASYNIVLKLSGPERTKIDPKHAVITVKNTGAYEGKKLKRFVSISNGENRIMPKHTGPIINPAHPKFKYQAVM